MPPRKDISLQQIVDALDVQGTKAGVARVLGCSEGLIYRRLREGIAESLIDKRCSCCEMRPVAYGNRMLCLECYTQEKNCNT